MTTKAPANFKRTHIHYGRPPGWIRVVEHESRPSVLITILEPRWSVGDRARNISGYAGHGAEVIVEAIEGPYTHRYADRQDAYLYRVYEADRDMRYPIAGKALERI